MINFEFYLNRNVLMIKKSKYKHLIFDLGGVLIELGESPIPPELLPADKKISIEEWFSLTTAHQFERGEISPEQFANTFIEELHIDISVEEFLGYFSKWPKRIFPNATNILENISRQYRLSVLSNCNEIHWPIMEHEFKILDSFDYCFSSHNIGLTKPDTSVFKYVLENLKTHPKEVLFFDDNIENIKAAQGLGISAVQVKGIEELEYYLLKTKILL
jgi:glucose-1-phosphatase